jgi:hypothetical protein
MGVMILHLVYKNWPFVIWNAEYKQWGLVFRWVHQLLRLAIQPSLTKPKRSQDNERRIQSQCDCTCAKICQVLSFMSLFVFQLTGKPKTVINGLDKRELYMKDCNKQLFLCTWLLDEIVHGFEASCFLLSKNVGHPVKNLDSNGLRHPVILCDKERNSPTLKQWWWFCLFHWTATEEEYASSMPQM